MEKIYIVHWGSAGSDDDGSAKAFCGVHGVYTSKSAALNGLTECKDAMIQSTTEYVGDEAFDILNIHIYGSENEEYFEIDYMIDDTPCEIYITISEQ